MINLNILNEGISKNFGINPISESTDESYGIFVGNSHRNAENSDVYDILDSIDSAVELAKKKAKEFPTVIVKRLNGSNDIVWDSDDLNEEVTFGRGNTGHYLDNIDQNTGEVLLDGQEVEKLQRIVVNSGLLRGASSCTLSDDSSTCVINLDYILEFSKDQLTKFINKLSEYGLTVTSFDNVDGKISYGTKDNRILTLRRFFCDVDMNKVDSTFSGLNQRFVGYIPKSERQQNISRVPQNQSTASTPRATTNNNVSSVAIQITHPNGNPIYVTPNGARIDARNYEPQKCVVPTPAEGKWILPAAKDKMRQNIRNGAKVKISTMHPDKVYHMYFAAKMIGFTDFINRVFENKAISHDIIDAIDQYFI